MPAHLIELQSSDPQRTKTTLVIDPIAGGQVVSYATDFPECSIPWMKAAQADHPACFVMVPFCSRIADARFDYDGATVCLVPNDPPHTYAIHGQGWQEAWEVDSLADDNVTLSYTHEPDDWPWRYRVSVRYGLTGPQLRVDMRTENLSGRSMPLGVGLHPYFPRDDQSFVQAGVTHWVPLDAHLMPIGLQTLPAALNLTRGLVLPTQGLDHVFTPWNGQALMRWPAQSRPYDLPARRLQMTSNARHLVVWSPPGADFFCVEGVTNLPNGFNNPLSLPDSFTHLPAGGSHVGYWQFTPSVEDR